jgi:ribosomal protein S18 acetylase RimI-like enzyme
MSINFQHIGHEDIETVVSLMREYYAFDHLDFDEAVARSGVRTLVDDESLGRIWLLKGGDEVIGYVVLAFSFSLEFHGEKAFVDELYIREKWRGRGVGAATLEFLADVCRSLGIRAIRLEVEHANAAAQGLYRKMGFQVHERYLMTKWL